MKRAFLSAAVLGASVVPALAEGGGADTDVGRMLIQAITALAAKIADLF
jgi:hypothetical protein